MNLTNEFDSIREWSKEKGILDKSDVKTQFVKLMEETGELSRAILKNNKEEFIDSIGDAIVVLTNIAALGNVKIENCINSAYSIISQRKAAFSAKVCLALQGQRGVRRHEQER